MAELNRKFFLVSLGAAGLAGCSKGTASYIVPGQPTSATADAPVAVTVRRTGNLEVEALLNDVSVMKSSVSTAGFTTVLGNGNVLATPFQAAAEGMLKSVDGVNLQRSAANKFDINVPGGSLADRKLSISSTANGSTRFSYRAGQAGDTAWPDADIVIGNNIFVPDRKIRAFKSVHVPFSPAAQNSPGGQPVGVKPMGAVCDTWTESQNYYDLMCSCNATAITVHASCYTTTYNTGWNTIATIPVGGSSPDPTALSDCVWELLITAGVINASFISEAAWATLTEAAFAAALATAWTGLGLIAFLVAAIIATLVTLGLAWADETVATNMINQCLSQLGI